ncbi:MAG: VPLPA-CTERM sorting domain-containing protein [Gammaproteobacteria bacterium]|nr:MAG: VPLPA-CTERM sorting domain-containing protein [Gammaproteobacteria bacterium]
MLSSIKRAAIAAVALCAGASAQAASVYLSPATVTPVGVGTVPAFFTVMLDLEGVTAQGGGFELDFSGVFSYTTFIPSDFFNDLNTDSSGDTDFTGYGNPPGDAELEIYLGSFAGITGLNSLGTIQVLQAAGAVGDIVLSASPSNRWGGFVGLDTAPIAGFTYDGATVVPLPATAWLLATGFGLASFWRRRRH